MKQRHIKTLYQKFGVNLNIKDKNALLRFNIELNLKIQEYIKYIEKLNKDFNIEECLSFIKVFHKGIFYLTALGAYEKDAKYPKGYFKDSKWFGYSDCGDNYTFNNDDEFCKRVKLTQTAVLGDKDYMEYQKYYVIETSMSGWSLVLTNYPKVNKYDIIFTKDDIILTGNVGRLV